MKRFEDYTDFEGENWNGWMNGRGLPTGELKTGENGNMYWSGLLKGAPGTFYKIQPSLLKRFSFQSAEERRALYEVYFLYRIHEREPDEAKDIAIAVCSEGGRVVGSHTNVTDETPVGQWLKGYEPGAAWFAGGAQELWIGTGGGLDSAFRKVDIDNIRVKRVTSKSE